MMERMSDLVQKWNGSKGNPFKTKHEDKTLTRCNTSKDRMANDSSYGRSDEAYQLEEIMHN